MGEIVQIVFRPRSKKHEKLGVARIIKKEMRRVYYFNENISHFDAVVDGFSNIPEMKEWLTNTYGKRWLKEPMNKLTLRWN